MVKRTFSLGCREVRLFDRHDSPGFKLVLYFLLQWPHLNTAQTTLCLFETHMVATDPKLLQFFHVAPTMSPSELTLEGEKNQRGWWKGAGGTE